MSSPSTHGSTAKRSAPLSDLGHAQRVVKKQRRQLPVIRVNEQVPLQLSSTFSNPTKDIAICAPEVFHQKTQEEINAYLDKQGFESSQEYFREICDRQEAENLRATKTYTYADIEQEHRRKALRKEKINQSTEADWVTWSSDELLEVWDMHLNFPVPRRQTRKKLLEAIELLYTRMRLDENVARIMAGERLTVREPIAGVSTISSASEPKFGGAASTSNSSKGILGASFAGRLDSNLLDIACCPPKTHAQTPALAKNEVLLLRSPYAASAQGCRPVRTFHKHQVLHPDKQNTSPNLLQCSPCGSQNSESPQPPQSPQSLLSQKSNINEAGLLLPADFEARKEVYRQQNALEIASEAKGQAQQQKLVKVQPLEEGALKGKNELENKKKDQDQREKLFDRGFQAGPPILQQLIASTARVSESHISRTQNIDPSASPYQRQETVDPARRMGPTQSSATMSQSMSSSPGQTSGNPARSRSDGKPNPTQFHAPTQAVSLGSPIRNMNYIQLPDRDGPLPGRGLLQAEPPKPARGLALQELQFTLSSDGPGLKPPSTNANVKQAVNRSYSQVHPIHSYCTNGLDPRMSPRRTGQQATLPLSNSESFRSHPPFQYGETSTTRNNFLVGFTQSPLGVPDSGFSGQTQPSLQGIIGPQQPYQGSMLVTPSVMQLLPQQYQQGQTNLNTQQHYLHRSHGPVSPNGQQGPQNLLRAQRQIGHSAQEQQLQYSHGQTSPARRQIEQTVQHGHVQIGPKNYSQHCPRPSHGQANPDQQMLRQNQMSTALHSKMHSSRQQQVNFPSQQLCWPELNLL
jgi:hypothetical protein